MGRPRPSSHQALSWRVEGGSKVVLEPPVALELGSIPLRHAAAPAPDTHACRGVLRAHSQGHGNLEKRSFFSPQAGTCLKMWTQ